ncbi:HD-GYP domain-containing protein [Ureibacillus sp. FSL K6-3587]|uniref:HD-GYP domain-containing protein n=1 Tax=Ureibacillus suwonensis TaxID=313007 RepID=A0ABW0RDN3_9BACL
MKQELYCVFCKLMRELGEKDPLTFHHSNRVTKIAVFFAKELGLSKNERKKLEVGALLHDIGKIKIDGDILNKNGKLTDEEYEQIKKHPLYGFEILENNGLSDEISQLALFHHERWDGKGYPYGLAKEEIPFLSRLLGLADTFEAMTGLRPYRKPFTWKEAYEEIERNTGTQFDPTLAKEFLRWMEKKDFESTVQSVFVR